MIAKSCPTPMVSTLKLVHEGGKAVENAQLYWSLAGALQFVTITRPETVFSVNKICQFMHNSKEDPWKAMKRILRYLKCTIHHGLLLQKPSNLKLTP